MIRKRAGKISKMSSQSHNTKNHDRSDSKSSRSSQDSGDSSTQRTRGATTAEKPPMIQRGISKDSSGSRTMPPALKSPGVSSMKKSPSRDSVDRKQQNVEFALDIFTQKDPAESNLISVLEGTSDGGSRGRRTHPRGSVHQRRNSAKLPFLMKQMSSKRHLLQNSYGSKDAEEINTSPNYQSTQPASDSDIHVPVNEQNGPIPVRRRTSSASSKSDLLPAGGVRQRRISMQGRDLKPTSHYLSTLADNFDDSKRYDLDDEPGEENENAMQPPKPGHHRRQRTATDALADHAQHLESLFNAGPQDNFKDLHAAVFGEERRSNNEDEDDACSDISDEEDGDRDVEGGPDVRRPLLGRRGHRQASPLKRAYAYLLAFWSLIGPNNIWTGIIDFLTKTVIMVIVPLLGLSAILFYGFQNPDLAFLPTDATLSWWLIFVCRLLITWNLARASQYFLEILTVRTTVIVRIAGPFVALIAMQSTGWPFLIAAWGGWTMVLMHGYHPFVKNWLWFLHFSMFSKEHNPDHGVLESDFYGRVLLALMFVGAASAAKRTTVALYLSRRMLQHYRPQLQELLSDVRLVMEVAELAAETETEEFTKLVLDEHASIHSSYRTASTGGGTKVSNPNIALARNATKKLTEQVPTFSSNTRNNNLSFDTNDDSDDMLVSDDEESTGGKGYAAAPMSARSGKSGETTRSGVSKQYSKHTSTDDTESIRSAGPVQWNELKNQVRSKRSSTDRRERSSSPIELNSYEGANRRSHHAKGSSTQKFNKVIPQLERWEEPEEKGGKKALPSLFDILQFRKAMQFMENPYPFSNAFGPAQTRKECIKSSIKVYKRLLRFTPGESVLHFDIIGVLAYDDDGELDEDRAQALLGVFLPDKDDLLPQISFVQSCDYVYKHLRFLRASILNASKIDSVLEDVFDCAFYGVLTILLMTLLGFNPWPLLVSFSTVMVSFAFAFGPSAAKWIEGTLMIAVRRPYDIGDRITINSAENLSLPTDSDTWLVEDIGLTTTTLRFSATNEVSTVNNAAIANSRIVNCARSAKAIVTIKAYFSIKATQEEIESFRVRVENYLIDRPEIWAGMVHFRNDMVDNNQGYVEYLLRAQHQQEWQYLSPIMVQKGELQRFMDRVASDLGINWKSDDYRIRIVQVPPIRQVAGADDDNVAKTGDKLHVEPFLKYIQEETS